MNPISRRDFLKASGSLVVSASLPGAVAPAMSQSGTTFYFDWSTGNDGNLGTSPGAPLQTLTALWNRIAPGNILRLRRGIVWPHTGEFGDATLFILDKNLAGLCTITDYDDALNPPILDGLEYDNSATGWTHAGGGRWTKPFAAAIHRVMYGGSPANLSIGGLSWKGELPVAPNQWWWNNGTLHIFSSSTVSPPDFYQGLAYASTKCGAVVRVENSSNVLIERIRTLGGHDFAWSFVTSTSDNADIQLDDCEALHPAKFGFSLRAGGGGFSNRRVTMNRPVFDNKTDATENEGSSERQGGSDGFLIIGNYDDIVINDPTCIRARHSGINCYDLAAFTPGKLTVVARPGFGNFDSTVIEYGRALNLIGSKPSQNTRVSGIRSTGQATRSQFSGTCLVSGCSWKDMRFSTLPGYEVSQAIWFQSWDFGPGNSQMVNVTFQNNLIEILNNPIGVPVSPAIAFAKGTNTANSFDADKIKVYNNTIIDQAPGSANRKPIIAILDSGFGATPPQLVKNNNLISNNPGAQQVNWDNTLYTINGTPGFTGNVENIEGYVNRAGGDYHPTELGGLKHAGVLGVLGALDSDGLVFNNPPSIAPTEFVGNSYVLAIDFFNGGDADTLGANWTPVVGTAGIVTNEAGPKTLGATGDSIQRWSAIIWPDDQESKVTLRNTGTGTGAPGPAVRLSATEFTGYVVYANSNSTGGIARWLAGAFQSLGAGNIDFADGDVVRLRVVGSTLSLFKNDVLVDSVVDSSITSGSAGANFGANVARRLDDWSGSEIR